MLSIVRVVRGTATATLLLLAVSFVAANAQERPVERERLAKESDAIVVGKVKSMKSEWADSKQSRIITRVTLAVNESLKGNERAGGTVTIETLGGEVGDVGELYTHVPTFRQNEDVVVFLSRDADGMYRVAGGTQGKYIVEKDEATGKQVVAGKYPLAEFTASVKNAARN